MVGITERIKKRGSKIRVQLERQEDLVSSTLKLQEEGARNSLKKGRMFAEDILR